MSLVSCKECGCEISDKALKCPHCGAEQKEKIEEKVLAKCEECNFEFDDELDSCPKCGCPHVKPEENKEVQKVELSKVSFDKGTKKKIGIVVAVVVVVLLAILIGVNTGKKNDAKSYGETLSNATSAMLLGAISAEDAGSLIHDVWYNAIFDEYAEETRQYVKNTSDFNDALSNLFADSSFNTTLESIESNQELVQGYMKDLANPPEEYEDAYDAIKECYDAYLEFTNIALNPSGNLESFTDSYNSAQSDFINCYDEMDIYVSE